MEGNACYKYRTLSEFIARTSGPAIRVALDIGANIGNETANMRDFFPEAHVYAFEPVAKYFEILNDRFNGDARVSTFNYAITTAHLFHDYWGADPRAEVSDLIALVGQPNAGPGWRGGSHVRPREMLQAYQNSDHYALSSQKINARTLDEVVAYARTARAVDVIDYIKIDCEGSEIWFLGSAQIDTLARIRYLAGEYHGLAAFQQVLERRLFKTHNVSLIGDSCLGSFFAELIVAPGEPSILEPLRDGMRQVRPWLGEFPTEWNVFRRECIPVGLEYEHGYA